MAVDPQVQAQIDFIRKSFHKSLEHAVGEGADSEKVLSVVKAALQEFEASGLVPSFGPELLAVVDVLFPRGPVENLPDLRALAEKIPIEDLRTFQDWALNARIDLEGPLALLYIELWRREGSVVDYQATWDGNHALDLSIRFKEPISYIRTTVNFAPEKGEPPCGS